VTKWVRGDHIELVANPAYFQGPPKLRKIVLREIPDENTEINALRTHDVDWMFEPSPNLYLVLKTLPDIAIHFNDSPQSLNMLFNLTHPPLDDLRVRQAIAFAIDKASLVQKFTGGSATVAGADQTPSSWSYEPNVTTYSTDVAKARALLAKAGYTPGPDGMMQKNGKALSLGLSTNVENATRRLVETQVQAMLHAVGIAAEIKNYPANLFFATYGQGGIETGGKYDLSIQGWIAGIDPDDHSIFGCNQFPPNGSNYPRYCSKAMDAAQAAALGTYDQAKRKVAYSTIQKLIAHDLPELYFWYTRFPQATNPDLRGFAPNPISEAWNAYQWEI
jgi:peptide/nickel transport system substrate-binding protein